MFTRTTIGILIRAAVFCILGLVLLPAPGSAQNRLTDIRHWSSPTFTRIVFEMRSTARYNSFVLSQPDRLVVDVLDIAGSIPKKEIVIRDKVVKKVRVSARNKTSVRIVIDLQHKADHKIFPLKKVEGKPPRLVIDITRPDLEASDKAQREATRQRTRNSAIVVVDPGHGGEDPGAVSRKGTKEKTIAFAVAQKLVWRLNRMKGIKAYLTRKADYFIPLQRRVDIAKQYGADLFISIHADSSFSNRTAGSSIYCLSFKGASSNTARMLARKENASDFVGGVPLDQQNGDLSAIIFDLVQTHSLNASLQLAGCTLQEVKKINRLHTAKPQQANFAVLRAPDIPSMLIELDFISNPSREKRLKNSNVQHDFARSIAAGVQAFLSGKQPEPIRYRVNAPAPAKTAPRYLYHVVKRGDTLSELAERYGSGTSSLRRLNGLGKRSVLRVGQKLKVPGGSRPAPTKKRPSYRYHVVKRGDTLSELAKRYGSSTSSLRRLNGLG
ncbi:MAG: LysM peptidoglycan-binding domain-containing protein, partial [Deltaproteobacteria bacterium]|nr:LysM peptidoglycan-binding domain-containing protein [Deltaproteobacteria bacterium]